MSLHFYSYARKGYEFIEEVALELKTGDSDKASRMTRSVLRAIRHRLTIEESFHLLAQLPMALKGIYVDGWKVSLNFCQLDHVSDFISEVIKEDAHAAGRDFSSKSDVKDAIVAVFKVLSRHLSDDEMKELLEVLPQDLQLLLQEEFA
jgi:uncharacterized protein (DUF2267 family)